MQVEQRGFGIRSISFIKLELWRVYLTYHIVKLNIINVLKTYHIVKTNIINV